VKFLYSCIFFLAVIILMAPSPRADEVKQAVVKIYTVNNRHNYHEPWQMQGQSSYQGSGAIIAGKRILTNAHVVSDHTFIQVRRAGKAKKYTAAVEIIAHESDLAILKVRDASFFTGIQPLAIGELPKIRDEVSVYGFPEGGDKLSITEGVVSRVEHSNYAHSGAYLLTCQIDAPINAGNSGGPVIQDDRIVGVAFQGLSNERFDNIGYMVPVPVINHFLDDIQDGKHDGTPDLGISMQQMENPDLRSDYLMSDEQTGVLVNKVYPDSPATDLLKSGDVILAIDGTNVDNDGTIEFRKDERTFFTYLLQQKQMNDAVDLDILREGRKKRIAVKLTKVIDYERIVPNRQFDRAPTYFITGGLVFEPLTLNYLMEFGSGRNWYVSAPTELLNYYLNGEPEQDQREIVILVKVLADEINIGYHDSQNVVISRVNGKKISTMGDLVAAFERHKGTYHVIEDIRGYKIVLARESVDEHGPDILKKYKIGSDRSEDLK
jgi:S1-C subfamily serine protease